MSVALFIVAEREVPGLDVFVNGKHLAHAKHLDRLAEKAGVRPLMEFFSQDPEEAASFLEEEGIDLPPGGLPPMQWFSAEEGLATVRGMLALLASDPSAIADSDGIVEDLRGFEEVLGRLASEGVRWHLAVDY